MRKVSDERHTTVAGTVSSATSMTLIAPSPALTLAGKSFCRQYADMHRVDRGDLSKALAGAMASARGVTSKYR
jgi:hypothetical protein